jgi:hypothetical protein
MACRQAAGRARRQLAGQRPFLNRRFATLSGSSLSPKAAIDSVDGSGLAFSASVL